jgi:hypothetical protein
LTKVIKNSKLKKYVDNHGGNKMKRRKEKPLIIFIIGCEALLSLYFKKCIIKKLQFGEEINVLILNDVKEAKTKIRRGVIPYMIIVPMDFPKEAGLGLLEWIISQRLRIKILTPHIKKHSEQ